MFDISCFFLFSPLHFSAFFVSPCFSRLLPSRSDFPVLPIPSDSVLSKQTYTQNTFAFYNVGWWYLFHGDIPCASSPRPCCCCRFFLLNPVRSHLTEPAFPPPLPYFQSLSCDYSIQPGILSAFSLAFDTGFASQGWILIF